MSYIAAIGAASAAWFVTAGAAFFNPIVDKIYRSEEGHPAVRTLPQNPATIGKILLAVAAQVVLWAAVYHWVKDALPASIAMRGATFGGVICLVKIVPRDIDRVLLTTYPPKRLTIEFIVGVLCAFVVGLLFAYLI